MDSLTQIVLGSAVGEAVLGRKIGNKAILYGAIAGTIPDLDVLATSFTETTRALEIHRGFSHSLLFVVLFSPICAWIVTRYEKHKVFKDWAWFFFWVFLTHPILDSFTTWGTQLFWPFDLRLAFKTIFVIDPLYTIPFLVLLILAMLRKRNDPKRQILNNWGLGVSTTYLALTILLKILATSQFEKALDSRNIQYSEIQTRPSPLNTILWSANVDTEDAYLLANYSFFDSQRISFSEYPKNRNIIGDLAEDERVQRMMRITNGWYIISEENERMYFNDLRFGVMGNEEGSMNFAFKYEINENGNGDYELTEVQKSRQDASKLLAQLWDGIKGN